MRTEGRIHWIRIIVAAFLLEAALVVAAIPMRYFLSMQVFVVVVPPAVLVAGFLLGWWAGRKLESRFVLHGLLIGLVATGLYLAMCRVALGSAFAAVEIYGPFLFVAGNALRIVGAVAGCAFAGRTAKRS